MIIDTTQSKIEQQIAARQEPDEVFNFVLEILASGKLPTPAMFVERGWDYKKYIHVMVSTTRSKIENCSPA